MSLKTNSLADGTLSSSEAQMYKVPTGSSAALSALFLYNPNATSETIVIKIKRGAGTARQVRRIVLAAYESYTFDKVFMLSSEDSIRGSCTSSVNYEIGGGVG